MATPNFTARTLRRLMASGVLARAERLLAKLPPADIAPLLADLTEEEIRSVLELLIRQRRAALVLRELPPELLPRVFDAVADQRLADVLRAPRDRRPDRAGALAAGGAPRGGALAPARVAARGAAEGRALPRVERRPRDDHASSWRSTRR